MGGLPDLEGIGIELAAELKAAVGVQSLVLLVLRGMGDGLDGSNPKSEYRQHTCMVNGISVDAFTFLQ